MPESRVCAKCGSKDIFPARPWVEGDIKLVAIDSFWKAGGTRLTALVCAACGYTELYAEDARELQARHLRTAGK